MSISRKIAAEFIGTAALLMIVVGSGIMGETLANGSSAITLLANSLTTGAGLFVLIQCLGPISGAHFNPIVSLVEAMWSRLERKQLLGYWVAQFLGAIVGVWITHFIFNQTVIQIATKERLSGNLWLSEVLATIGLVSTIALAGRKHVEFAPMSVAAYVMAAYWFTSSTSFANPAVTVARMFTNTFCGIAPNGVLPFIAAQIVGACIAYGLLKWFVGNPSPPITFAKPRVAPH
jgi:glycerol uptake facilitator-like aquaporin